MKIFANPRDYEGKRELLIYDICVITDWNEVSYHLLDCMLTHLQHTRGPIPGSVSLIRFSKFAANDCPRDLAVTWLPRRDRAPCPVRRHTTHIFLVIILMSIVSSSTARTPAAAMGQLNLNRNPQVESLKKKVRLTCSMNNSAIFDHATDYGLISIRRLSS